MSNGSLHVNAENWIEENKNAFLPPVCNKLMHISQLLIMFVGGPNVRKDYHIEEGEELFFQLKGDMCLKVIENGKHKDVHIREGEVRGTKIFKEGPTMPPGDLHPGSQYKIFLLPARVPHSPQRQANTVGLVVERRRLLTETDCLRYYVDNTTDVLFERWFYCENLGIQLVPIIKEFFASNQFRTGKPDPNEVFRAPPFQLNTVNVMSPFSFNDWLEKQRPSLASGNPIDIFSGQFETEAKVYGPGLTETTVPKTDVWIWQMEGSSRVTLNEEEFTICTGDSLLIPEQSQYQWQRDEGTVALFVVQNPERKRP